jgi:hypothetical protein
MTRRVGGRGWTVTSEITEISPPGRWAIRGIDGPIRATVKIAVEPRDGGQQSHVIIDLEFSGHGIGEMLLPMATRQGRKLKQRLESTGRGARNPTPGVAAKSIRAVATGGVCGPSGIRPLRLARSSALVKCW